MGVHGLWKLIESAGKPVPVETLENKVLAVDVSIWLHQLMKGYQTPSGSSVSNAYLLGLFTRVCKLLFTNVKPVFVFDGGVPQLKKKTIAARQQQKDKSSQASEKLRQQLLKNLLKQKAVSQVLEEIRGQSSPKKKERDMFELPPLPENEDSLSELEEMFNSSSEEDVKPIKMKFKDLHTIDVKSADFRDLPADIRHDILTELKETRKQNSWGRIHEMPEELGDFSKYQMSRLLKRRSVQVSLEEAEKEMGGRTLSLIDVETLLAEGGVEINPQLTKRIASDDVTRYIYVRDTGEQSSSSQGTVVSTSSKEKMNSSQGENSSFNPDIKIKEEIIDCDELSDSELIKEVEAIEMAHIGSNIKKEENFEFGTEEIFEDDTSSEGVIIDDMDLVKDTSGLSQEQILAIIRRENQDKGSFTDRNIPSTSKGDNSFQSNFSVTKFRNDNSVHSASEKTIDLSETSKSNESKIFDSLFFKINKKRMKSALSEKSKQIVSNENHEFVNLNTSTTDIKKDVNFQKLLKPSDVSNFPSESNSSEMECTHNLPCEVSLLELPKTSSKLFLNQSPAVAGSNKVLTLPESTELGDVACLTSSESDSEFVEVPASTGEVSSLNNHGLEIQIQTTQEHIHNDIFADIFVKDKSIKQSIGNIEIKPNIKSFQIQSLPSRNERFSHTERKLNNQSVALPSLQILDKPERIVMNKTSNVIKQTKKETNLEYLQNIKHASVENSKHVQDLPMQKQTVQQPQILQVHRQVTIQANRKSILGSKIKNQTSLESKRDVKVIQIQEKGHTFYSYQGNRKHRQSLYTKKQENQANAQNLQINNQGNAQSSQKNNERHITKTVKEILHSIFSDDESDNESVDEHENLPTNEESFENKELQNHTEMDKEIGEFCNKSEGFESVKRKLDISYNLTNQGLLSNKGESIHKQNEELQRHTKMEKEICSDSSFESVKGKLDLTPSLTNPALLANEEEFGGHIEMEKEMNSETSFESVTSRLDITPILTNPVSFSNKEDFAHNRKEKLKKHSKIEKAIDNKSSFESVKSRLDINPSLTEPVPFSKEESIHKHKEQLKRYTEIEKAIDNESIFESKTLEPVKSRLDVTNNLKNQVSVSSEKELIHEQIEESVTFDVNPSILETNAILEGGICSSLNATADSESQTNLQLGFEGNEDVDEPEHTDQSDDPHFSEAIGQSKMPKRILDMRELEKLQDILETKERELVVDQNREDRLATSLTDQMYQEAQELLRLFGVPYIVAPMEAEAQCAFLDASGLTEGTITDDSDIWLFGGRKVYKNFFDQKKFVLEFQSGVIQQYFKLDRSHMVLLALLVGSDYTVGLSGVGPVTALEILSTFPLSHPDTRDTHELLVSLTRFREWWRARPDTHTALAKKLRNVDVNEGFPSPAVVSAYLNPLVDDSREPFTWGTPDIAALRDYAESKFGWSRSRTDQVLLPAVNKLSQRTSQLTLHTFFGAVPNISAHRQQMSRRVQSAVNRLDGGSEEFTPLEPRPRQSRGRRGGRGGRGRGRGVPLEVDEELPFLGAVSKGPEVIPQKEKDKAEATKRKQQAIEVLKSKKQRGMKKRRNVRQEKLEANLSESSSDDLI